MTPAPDPRHEGRCYTCARPDSSSVPAASTERCRRYETTLGRCSACETGETPRHASAPTPYQVTVFLGNDDRNEQLQTPPAAGAQLSARSGPRLLLNRL